MLPPVIVSVTNSLCKHLQVSAPSMQTMWVCKLVSLIKHHHFFKAIRDCPQKSSCTRDKARVKLTGVLHNRTSQTISCLDYRICRPLVLNIDIWYHSCRPLVQTTRADHSCRIWYLSCSWVPLAGHEGFLHLILEILEARIFEKSQIFGPTETNSYLEFRFLPTLTSNFDSY